MSRRNRPSSVDHIHAPQLRAEVAHVAARLMAEGSVTDYGMAKRKALRQLGLPEAHPLPPNEEVEAALREYHHIFQPDEQAERLAFLRETAIELMQLLAPFNPYLTGSVLDGTAGPHTAIDILLFADSAKEVEIFLLNRGIDVEHADSRNERVEAVLVMETDTVEANLVIMSPLLERVSLKHRDGRPRERVRADALRALLSE